jgi:hypothetical protein
MYYRFSVVKDNNGKPEGKVIIDNPHHLTQQYDHFTWTFMSEQEK